MQETSCTASHGPVAATLSRGSLALAGDLAHGARRPRRGSGKRPPTQPWQGRAASGLNHSWSRCVGKRWSSAQRPRLKRSASVESAALMPCRTGLASGRPAAATLSLTVRGLAGILLANWVYLVQKLEYRYSPGKQMKVAGEIKDPRKCPEVDHAPEAIQTNQRHAKSPSRDNRARQPPDHDAIGAPPRAAMASPASRDLAPLVFPVCKAGLDFVGSQTDGEPPPWNQVACPV